MLSNFVSESGYLHKAVLLQSGAHIIEEIKVFEQPQSVKSLELSIPKVNTEINFYSSIYLKSKIMIRYLQDAFNV